MKNLFISLIFIFLIFNTGCGKKENQTIPENKPENNKPASLSIEDYFSKQFSGTLENSGNITINLTKFDSLISGNVFYEKSGNYTFLYDGKIDRSGKIEFSEVGSDYTTDKPIGKYLLRFTENNYLTGVRQRMDDNKTESVKLTEAINNKIRIEIKKYIKKHKIKDIEAEFSHLLPEIILDNKPELQQEINQQIIKRLYTTKYEGREMGPEGEMDEFIKSFEDLAKDGAEYLTGYTNNMEFNVLMLSDNMISFEISGYIFTGGAHGMPVVDCFTVDLEKGRILTFADIFKKGSEKKLSALLYDALKKETGNNDEDLKSQLEIANIRDKYSIPVTRAFAILNNGIRFDYAPYELGCYAFGSHYLFIENSKLTVLKN